MSGLVHFYSHATGVSLELPVGWELASQDAASATYAVLDDDGVPVPGAALRVQSVAAAAGGPADRAATAALLDGAERAGEVVRRSTDTVDEQEVSTVVVRDEQGRLRHTSASAGERRIVLLAGDAGDDDGAAVLDAAVASIRFVEL